MKKSSGPTYTRYVCCVDDSCSKLSSFLDVSDCYSSGGKLVKINPRSK